MPEWSVIVLKELSPALPLLPLSLAVVYIQLSNGLVNFKKNPLNQASSS